MRKSQLNSEYPVGQLKPTVENISWVAESLVTGIIHGNPTAHNCETLNFYLSPGGISRVAQSTPEEIKTFLDLDYRRCIAYCRIELMTFVRRVIVQPDLLLSETINGESAHSSSDEDRNSEKDKTTEKKNITEGIVTEEREQVDEVLPTIQAAIAIIKSAIIEKQNEEQIETILKKYPKIKKEFVIDYIMAMKKGFGLSDDYDLDAIIAAISKEALEEIYRQCWYEYIKILEQDIWTLCAAKTQDEINEAANARFLLANDEQGNAAEAQQSTRLALQDRLDAQAAQAVESDVFIPAPPCVEPGSNGTVPKHPVFNVEGRVELAKYQVAITKQDKNGDTFLHHAIQKGSWPYIFILLRHGAPLHITNNRNGHGEIPTEKLTDAIFSIAWIDSPADEKQGKKQGKEKNKTDAKPQSYKFLKDQKLREAQLAFLLCQDPETGNTPLHWMIIHGHRQSVNVLIALAKKLECLEPLLQKRNKKDEDFLHVADRNGNTIFHLICSGVDHFNNRDDRFISSVNLVETIVEFSKQQEMDRQNVVISTESGLPSGVESTKSRRNSGTKKKEKISNSHRIPVDYINQTVLHNNKKGVSPLQLSMSTYCEEYDNLQLVKERTKFIYTQFSRVLEHIYLELEKHRTGKEFDILRAKLAFILQGMRDIDAGHHPDVVLKALKESEVVDRRRSWLDFRRKGLSKTVQRLNKIEINLPSKIALPADTREAPPKETSLHLHIRTLNVGEVSAWENDIKSNPSGFRHEARLLYAQDVNKNTPLGLALNQASQCQQQRLHYLAARRVVEELFSLVIAHLTVAMKKYESGSKQRVFLEAKLSSVNAAQEKICSRMDEDPVEMSKRELNNLIKDKNIQQRRIGFWQPRTVILLKQAQAQVARLECGR